MNYAKELESLAKIESLTSLEFRVQFFAIFGCVATAIAATGLWVLAVWFILHYILVYIERIAAVHSARHPSATAFYTVISMNLAVGVTFAWLPVYLWTQGHPSFYFASMALLVGSTLNTFLIRSTLWYQAICFVAPNAGAFLVISLTMSNQGLPVAEIATLIAIASAVFVYFLISVVEMHRMHNAHEHTKNELLQSQKNEVVGQLTGGVAHDFNNLLNVISGYLELALTESAQAERDIAIRGALGATTKGATLVQHLLAFARKARLESQSIPVQHALSDLNEMARRVMPSSIGIEFGEAKPDLLVLADPALLTTALLNLILNSRDAISGSGIIQVDVHHCNADELPSGLSHDKKHNYFVVFTVKDDGKGIAPDIIKKATEPFFTTKPIGFGSGLGLSMVQGFAQQSGGGIFITSEIGVGTTVYLALPVGTASPEPNETLANTEDSRALSGQVLIVEDHPELLQIIARLTGSLGFAPHKASTADEACALIDSGLRPALLITDAVMPGRLQMVDLLALVKTLNPSTKIIVMSGYDELQIDRVTDDLPSFTFIQKPFTLAGLGKSVKELMHSPVV